MPDNQKLEVSTTVEAPQDKAWKAYTSADAIPKWNFASDDWCCPTAKVDLKVGGNHSARMEAKDGSVGFDFNGKYEEVDAPHALTLILEDGRRSRTTFEAAGARTTVRTIFDADSEAPVEMQQSGWQSILDNFRRYVEST
ncbi:activator of HSP90 ATPase [Erythrobacter vulgaris]|uniref:Activator of HSP90 ATPase n=1 Tax=Qipengyuania vulgaris TaxID=291985 RepID=A0A844XU58_9SPHN|nr:SRPBCC domain-containing protein [Qipengyuania vulgaris]MXO48939.1 activator of HSP90 ATPase [Qipengyuania vulgaris]